MKGRNFQAVADEIIKVIDEECDFAEEKVVEIIEQIEELGWDNE